jgi:phosphoribosylaminoimidazole-succinocarboxamide synthase
MKFLTSGKVKDVYDLEDGNLLFKFSNRVSAYDVKFKDEIPKKGEVLCKFAEFWFEKLNVPNHFVKTNSETEITVKKMDMLPIECIVRGYFYGSMVSRWKNNEIILDDNASTELASELSKPVFDPTTKSSHDVPVDKTQAISQQLVTSEEFDLLSKKSIEIYQNMRVIADEAGFILADLKLEFGKLNNEILLGDSIGPDEFRLWPKDSYEIGKIQETYDKQLLRDWLTKYGYQEQFNDSRASGNEPIAPSIPPGLITKMTQRYVMAYEHMTGKTL